MIRMKIGNKNSHHAKVTTVFWFRNASFSVKTGMETMNLQPQTRPAEVYKSVQIKHTVCWLARHHVVLLAQYTPWNKVPLVRGKYGQIIQPQNQHAGQIVPNHIEKIRDSDHCWRIPLQPTAPLETPRASGTPYNESWVGGDLNTKDWWLYEILKYIYIYIVFFLSFSTKSTPSFDGNIHHISEGGGSRCFRFSGAWVSPAQ